jgi:hypothetical protein
VMVAFSILNDMIGQHTVPILFGFPRERARSNRSGAKQSHPRGHAAATLLPTGAHRHLKQIVCSTSQVAMFIDVPHLSSRFSPHGLLWFAPSSTLSFHK